MLKRIYVDNFRCLVNFEWEPGPAHINLMLGPNGSGKTTVFECLEALRAFATGDAKLDDLFAASTLTQWQNVLTQSLEIDWEREGSVYRYEVAIVHNKNRTHREVAHERLSLEGKPLLRFEKGYVHLWGGEISKKTQVYPFAWKQSAMASLPTTALYSKHTWLKTALDRTTVLQIVPPMMDETSLQETTRPLRYFQNFVSWYRWISNDHGMAIRLEQELKEILPGFSHFKLESHGPEAKLLKAVFDHEGQKPVELSFSCLSDGQRMLIALYALLHSLRAQPEESDGDNQPTGLLCLDEPDNFIASREIQPWLTAIEDQLLEAKARLLLISHHPESIDYGLMPSTGETLSVFWFSREAGGHSRVQTLLPEQNGGLKPSELAARGWLGLGGQAPEEPAPAKKPPRRKITKLKQK
jgi:energy-coupling factor transporter ATP-binding protein EcfA2